ncbi:hypothetical protein [Paenibacillus periandrae]|uniref:hypothetical protein n=1 Tax=Paenibacillus periandrae TaxID=1761741 RepID=UPI001F08A2A8|nr:hypothetical protein [Paenibacillus periandrae]
MNATLDWWQDRYSSKKAFGIKTKGFLYITATDSNRWEKVVTWDEKAVAGKGAFVTYGYICR